MAKFSITLKDPDYSASGGVNAAVLTKARQLENL
jgi:hypothetical protein